MKKIRKYSGIVDVSFEVDLPRFAVPTGTSIFLILVTNSKDLSPNLINSKDLSPNLIKNLYPPYVNRLNIRPANIRQAKEVIVQSNPFENILRIFHDLKYLLNQNFRDEVWKDIHLNVDVSTLKVELAIDSGHPDFPIENKDGKVFIHILRRNIRGDAITVTNYTEIDFGGGYFKFQGTRQEENTSECFVSIDFGNNSTVANISFLNNKNKIHIVKRSSVVSLKKEITNPNATKLGLGDKPPLHESRNDIPVWTGNQEEKGLQLFSANCFTSAHKFPKRALSHPESYIDLGKNTELNNIQNSSLEIMYASSNPNDVNPLKFALPKRLPAELFLFDFLDRISAVEMPDNDERVGTPAHIILTYPTTYMVDEILKLRKSFIRAYLRRLDIPSIGNSTSQRPDLISNQKLLRLKVASAISDCKTTSLSLEDLNSGNSVVSNMLDEASAAAYFYIKNVLLSDYGLKGFRLLHPEGCGFVIVDIGAGTTDVAAFDLSVTNGDTGLKMIVKLSKLTGDQNFCGDFITKQIARLIKAKIVDAATNAFIQPLNSAVNTINSPKTNNHPASTSSDLITRSYNSLKTNDVKDFLKVIPGINSEFDSTSKTSEKERFLTALVDEAERIKKAISLDIKKNDFFLDQIFLNNILRNGIDDKLKEKIAEACKKITIDPKNIEELIKKELERLCNSINNSILIPSNNDRKEDACLPKIVKEVVLTGKGSIYPFIIDKFKEKLSLVAPSKQIVSLKDKFSDSAQLDHDYLKNCVSIGARMFLEDSMNASSEIKFENDLIEELPFDVFVDDPQTNSKKLLFNVQTKYKDMDERKGKEYLIHNKQPQNANRFNLPIYRRFPGGSNEDYEKFMEFTLENINNNFAKKIMVYWDSEEMSFQAKTDAGDQIPSKRINNGQVYFESPLWSGKI